MTTDTARPAAPISPVSRGPIVAAAVLLLLVAAFGVNVLLSSVLPATWPLPILQLLVAAGTVAVALPLTAATGRRLAPARPLTARGLRSSSARRTDAAVGLAIGLVAATLPFAVAMASDVLRPVAILDRGDLGLLVGVVLLVVAMVFVATWEELLLRGVLVGELDTALRRRFPRRTAATLAVAGGAVLFGLGHAGQPDQPVLLLTWIVAGLVFGAIYVLDGDLALVIGAHAGFNVGHNALLVRADLEATDRLSALVRVELVDARWWLAPGGIIELAGFLLVAGLALLWLRLRRGHRSPLVPPALDRPAPTATAVVSDAERG